jgi:hypothetical protein
MGAYGDLITGVICPARLLQNNSQLLVVVVFRRSPTLLPGKLLLHNLIFPPHARRLREGLHHQGAA